MPRALQLLVLAAAGLAAPALVSTWIEDAQTRSLIATAALVSVVGFLATAWLVPQVRSIRRGNAEPVWACRHATPHEVSNCTCSNS